MTVAEYVTSIRKVNERAAAAEALLRWAETTHGNEFGHDHHCQLTTDWSSGPDKGPWVEPPGDPKVCTCGWSAFRVAYEKAQAPR